MSRLSATRRVLVAIAVLSAAAPAAGGAAPRCIDVGVYQARPESPSRGVQALERRVGRRVTTVSTYVTAGGLVPQAVIDLAKARRLRLMVTWMPDNGRDVAEQPAFRLQNIAAGRFDAGVRTLARQLKASGLRVVLRPMPEPNTPWYAWSGTANGNSPEQYGPAFARIARVARKAGGRRLRVMWTPYARSVPETDANRIGAYWPGPEVVDLTGAVAYNFGAAGELQWADPAGLFQDAYTEIRELAPKPFWIAETGSVRRGGDRAAWVRALAALRTSMPGLAGVVWMDGRDGLGDFRVGRARTDLGAFRALLGTACRVRR